MCRATSDRPNWHTLHHGPGRTWRRWLRPAATGTGRRCRSRRSWRSGWKPRCRLPRHVPPAAARWGITRREFDVLGLVAQGLTDQEIADGLFIGRRTVHTHVAACWPSCGSPTGAKRLPLPGPKRLLARSRHRYRTVALQEIGTGYQCGSGHSLSRMGMVNAGPDPAGTRPERAVKRRSRCQALTHHPTLTRRSTILAGLGGRSWRCHARLAPGSSPEAKPCTDDRSFALAVTPLGPAHVVFEPGGAVVMAAALGGSSSAETHFQQRSPPLGLATGELRRHPFHGRQGSIRRWAAAWLAPPRQDRPSCRYQSRTPGVSIEGETLQHLNVLGHGGDD